MDPKRLDHHNPPPWRNRNGGVKTAAWQTFRRRSTLHHAVKNKRITVQGPVKKPQTDYMLYRGVRACLFPKIMVPPSDGPTVGLVVLRARAIKFFPSYFHLCWSVGEWVVASGAEPPPPRG